MTGIWVYYIIVFLFLIYAISIIGAYGFLSVLSYRAIRNYINENSFINYNQILSSPLAPKVSLLAPAYNEGLNIVDNVRSLLSLQYANFEVVIVNDGSKDNSMDLLLEAYQLVRTDYYVYQQVPCKEILGVYKSENESFRSLTVVDKFNGGKADALNAGINISSGELIACIDVDCVLEPDAILRMVKPFMEEREKRVIATGGVIRIANDCDIKEGRLLKVRLPQSWICRWQVLEYMRAFLLGRMGWAKLNGLLLISGAFGLFDKRLVIEAGGYSHDTVGEDMELVVRMRRIMEEKNEPYTVEFIPDPLCWTEAPDTWKILGRQRNRWTRGTMDSLRFHRIMFFNPKYGILGMFSYPYWFFFEWMAPLVELAGLVITLLLFLFGYLNVYWFLLMLFTVYSFAICMSFFAIWTDQRTYMQYKNPGEQIKLMLAALTEPFIYHPFLVWQGLMGNFDYIRGKQSWGTMTRKGISTTKSVK